ncbi:flagellar filament capping protein FliD [Nitrincola alkalisediminis]|uniref:flagellar filament capping protein FliD n=1 Tax=Nitrincola alkalisediminis TaxID=1366656 RepID=UPI001875BFD4|nr:flagellar filament capping protein FliD [Nitrincola alkalisediminis]
MSTNLVTALGAGSGIDTKTLVSDLVAIERQPAESRLDKKQSNLEAQISGYGVFKSGLSEFQSLLRPLSDPNTFSARSVSFTESNTVTPTKLDADAVTGNYQVEVLALARSQSLATGIVSDRRAEIGTGTLEINFGTWNTGETEFTRNTSKETLQITIDATNNSLEGVRDAINRANAGVQASIIQDGGQFRLMISSPTGEANALSVTATDTGGSGPALSSMFNFNETSKTLTQGQAATDASLKINGLEIKRDSNEIKNVIAGLEFTINKQSPGEIINFSITEDKGTGEQAIRDFVEGFNTFYKLATDLTGYSRNETNQLVKGDLASDGIAKSMVSRLREMLVSSVPGVNSDFSSLATLGIKTELDGTLSINEKEFSAAINNNFDKLAAIFSPQIKSNSSSVTGTLGTAASNAQAGRYEIEITTAPEKGKYTGNELDSGFQAFSTGTDDFSFRLRINGIESGLIQLPQNKTYNTAEELAADMQSLINADSKFSGPTAGIDVAYDTASSSFTFTSREYGKSSNVVFTNVSGEAQDNIGLAVRAGQAGKDVVGTINGVAGFGAGNVLLPALNSPAYGLNFTISESASGVPYSATIDYSQGLSGELNRLVANFLAKDGAIDSRESSLNRDLTLIGDEREKLDTRMDRRFIQLQAQFLAMERIISNFQATGDQLDGLLDRLPFTAKRR